MRLAIDVMGGDHAPDAVLKGCIESLPTLAPDDEMVLVGPRDIITDVLNDRGICDPRIVIEHASEVIGMDESAAKAVRSKTDSSIVKMARLGSVKAARRADAVMSAGSTGACVTAGIMHMKRLPGVHRPGIAVTIPAFHGPVVLIDAGANPEPRAAHLWQYGIMADEYARHVLKIQRPRVAQMNIGAEEGKGTDIVKSARDLLKATPDINYIGYVEGRDFFDGVADVVVTDGFVGNTLLKMAEGLARSLFMGLAHQIFAIDPDLAMKLEPVVREIYKRTDYHEHGGAPLLGVNGGMIIAHGSSEQRSIRAAIRKMREFVKTGVNEAIVARIAKVGALGLHAAEPEKEPA